MELPLFIFLGYPKQVCKRCFASNLSSSQLRRSTLHIKINYMYTAAMFESKFIHLS